MKRFNKILLVDDDAVCNYIAEEILESLNISKEIVTALNGEEALRHVLFKQNAIDLIFLDLNMPVMNGFEFLHQLYSKIPDWGEKFKIIILTSSTNDKELENIRSTPVDGLIVKPLTPEKIEEILDIVLGKPAYISNG